MAGTRGRNRSPDLGRAGFLPDDPDRTEYWELVRLLRAAPDADIMATVESHKWRYSTFKQRCNRERIRQNTRDRTNIRTWKDWLHGTSTAAAPTEDAEESTAIMIRDGMLSILKEMTSKSRMSKASIKDLAYMYQVLATQHPNILFALPTSESTTSTPTEVAAIEEKVHQMYERLPVRRTVDRRRLKPHVAQALRHDP
jgi:hypothetical protein